MQSCNGPSSRFNPRRLLGLFCSALIAAGVSASLSAPPVSASIFRGIPIQVQVAGPSSVPAGSHVSLGILTSVAGNGSLVDLPFQEIDLFSATGPPGSICLPQGGPKGCSRTSSMISFGFYEVDFTVPAFATGQYSVLIVVNDSAFHGSGFDSFDVSPVPSVPVSPVLSNIESSISIDQDMIKSISSNIDSKRSMLPSILSALSNIEDLTREPGISQTVTPFHSLQSSLDQLANLLGPSQATSSQLANASAMSDQWNSSVSATRIYLLATAIMGIVTPAIAIAILVRKRHR